ncbi:hypothetical protein AB0D73_27170 [Streptomyces sp. NPDC048215]|uniref:hypothetical protein n=1 Tax=Streptomyces sp. NPDC048215 TaxID=3156690 RepID=UPI003406DB11
MTTQTESSTDSTPAPTTAWHWVMTVQTPRGVVNTRTAIVNVPDGFTRDKLWTFVLDQFKADFGDTISVLFFDLQPNQL